MSAYPKNLYHPAYNAGIAGKPLSAVEILEGKAAVSGTPCRYPPVTVRNEDEEDRYRATGYMAQGESPVIVGFSDYPKMLRHPDHVDAVPDAIDMKKDDDGNLVRLVIPGKPERFPDVFVNDAEQEQVWLDKGYDLPGKVDPRAAVDARVQHIEGYEPEQFPKMVAGKVVDPNAAKGGPNEYPKFVDGQIVNNRAEEDALSSDPGELTPFKIERRIADRLAASLKGDEAEVERIEAELLAQGIALKDKPHGTVWTRAATFEQISESMQSERPSLETREALIAEATARGIKFDKRWSIHNLREALRSAAA